MGEYMLLRMVPISPCVFGLETLRRLLPLGITGYEPGAMWSHLRTEACQPGHMTFWTLGEGRISREMRLVTRLDGVGLM